MYLRYKIRQTAYLPIGKKHSYRLILLYRIL